MKIKDLKPNKKNPRKISAKKLDALKSSLEKFGDLSGFVFNRRTKTLVSGHQRQKTLPQDATIKIEIKHEVPTAAMTVAEGYVIIGEERFKYREVDADETWEMEALLAANKHGGDWDRDLLKVAIADLPGIDLSVTGFDIPELEAMNIHVAPISIGAVTAPESFEPEKSESDEDADAAYIAENPGPDSRVEKERLPSMVNEEGGKAAFDGVKEETEIKGKRYVIIIDCPNQETKDALKEKLQPEIDQAGAKVF